jgi:pimeloyl-ACP methyl ester carboxylesterase
MHYAVQGEPSDQPVIPLMPGNLQVYALDLRGHGDTDRPADGYRMRDLASDVIAFMAAQNIRRATVVGHSMGSFVAQPVQLATDAPS